MDTFSMSNDLSKGSVNESDSILKAYLDDVCYCEYGWYDGIEAPACC